MALPVLGAFRQLVQKNAEGGYEFDRSLAELVELLATADGHLRRTLEDRYARVNDPSRFGKDKQNWVEIHSRFSRALSAGAAG